MNKKKIIATASAVALAAVLAFGGTLTYYQGQADTPVENTLVDQGNSVSISESDVDSDGSTQSNTYSIIPGTTDKKDPVVTAEFTLDSYVYVKADDTTKGWIEWEATSAWTLVDGYSNVYSLLLKTAPLSDDWSDSSYTDADTGYVYTYNSDTSTYTVKDSTDNLLYTYTAAEVGSTTLYTASIPVIDGDTITYSSGITNETFDGYGSTVSLDFTAYIIQAWLGGTDPYGESVYADAGEAFVQVYGSYAATNGAVAMIGTTTYEDVSEAFLALTSEDTLTLLADTTMNSSVGSAYHTGNEYGIMADEYTVDLNGYTLTVNKTLNLTADAEENGEDLWNSVIESLVDAGLTNDEAVAYFLELYNWDSKEEAIEALSEDYVGYKIAPTAVTVKNGTIAISSNGCIYLSENTDATFEKVTFTYDDSTLKTAVCFYPYFDAGEGNALTFTGCTFNNTRAELKINSSYMDSATIVTTLSNCTYTGETTMDNVLNVGSGVATTQTE